MLSLLSATVVAFTFLFGLCTCQKTDPGGLVIVILSQDNSYHYKLAADLKDNILSQAAGLEKVPQIHILPDETSHIGYWTVVPVLPRLSKIHGRNSSWVYFCEDRTIVHLKRLMNGLSKHKSDEQIWLGFGLNDEEPSIIHHFAFAENPTFFKYPLFSAGFAISTHLLNNVTGRIRPKPEEDTDFSIDASHELALHIGLNRPLKHDPALFCDKKAQGCASYPARLKHCEPPLNSDEIFFAVKTCKKFHQNRVPFVKSTWGRDAKYIQFFSDLENTSIPTTDVGIKNTERGHCLKTLKILQMSLETIESKNLNNIKWVVLTDDDTILSVERLQHILACFETESLVGERYGYRVHLGRGYNYLTGGGGIAFGTPTLADIVRYCHCPAIDSPDDMVLGMCTATLGIPLIHSPLFHQARPMDYASSYLEIGDPVSFHKHWNLDPMTIYDKWFLKSNHGIVHTEL